MKKYNNWIFLVAIEFLYVVTSTLISLVFRESPLMAEINRTIARTIVLVIYVPIFMANFRADKPKDKVSISSYFIIVLSVLLLLSYPVLFQKSYFTGTLQIVWFIASFVVGFREEIFYRGIVQNQINRKSGLFWSVLTTSVLFTFYHVSYFILGNWFDLAEVFIFSLSIGIIYWKTKSIVLVGLIHGIYDAIPFVTPVILNGLPYYAGLLFLVLAFCVCVVFLKRRKT